MGKHDKKTGKGRLDKFYKLAKEQGYRARSAFKLIHLNRKYDLLAKSRCAIDLCAAPGGWLQVAEKYMPKGSLIIGVDLHPIKPLPHVSTFVADITTPVCRSKLKELMHDWKADLVMHDGAPNVGSAWVQDAFTQNELVLQSLKLATEFLAKGGNFVTKVFRSQDYNSLMWVFGQLFKSVEATKPPSSRNVSAEIFVVCQGFLAPKHIDPKFLDARHVFKDVASLPTSITAEPTDPSSSTSASASTSKLPLTSHAQTNVFMPEKKRRHREGYADGDYTLFHKANVSDFVKGVDPVNLLGSMNKIEFVTDEEKGWLKSRHTTSDIVANFDDLKVLGKGDFKALMKWRLAIRLEIGLDVKAEPEADATEEVVVEEMDEEEQISEELKRLNDEKMSKRKREKKRANEKKQKEVLKLQLGMTAPMDIETTDKALGGEEEIFDLGEGEKEMARRGVRGADLGNVVLESGMDEGGEDEEEEEDEESEDEEVLSSDEEREQRTKALEGDLDELYDQYRDRMSERDAKWKVKQARLKDKNFDAWHGIQEGSSDEGEDWKNRVVKVQGRGAKDAEDDDGEESEEGGWDKVAAVRAADEGQDSDSDSDEEQEGVPRRKKQARKADRIPTISAAAVNQRPQSGKLVTSLQDEAKRAQMSRQAQLWFDQSVFKGVGDLAALDGEEDEDEEEDVDGDDEEDGQEEDEEEEEEGDEDIEMEEASTLSSTLSGDQPRELSEDGEDDFEIVPAEPEETGPEWDVEDEDQDEVKQKIIKDKGLLTAEAVTLASQLVNRQITASGLIDQGFNRLSTFNKDNLPNWFLDDEAKFYKPNIPITKEAINALREKQRALDARPIKKVAEAKARKKFKAHQRMEKARKKADGVMDTEDLNEAEKARQVGKVMGRAGGKPKLPDKKIVIARGANKGVKGRPKGVKGRYKIVDARMRKETRALRRIKKASKKRS